MSQFLRLSSKSDKAKALMSVCGNLRQGRPSRPFEMTLESFDAIQISAAPLWVLFRNKPWKKVLKDSWAKLEKGDYDWAYLAMNYWPERVREQCMTDKSLAIALGLEDLYVELAKTSGGVKK